VRARRPAPPQLSHRLLLEPMPARPRGPTLPRVPQPKPLPQQLRQPAQFTCPHENCKYPGRPLPKRRLDGSKRPPLCHESPPSGSRPPRYFICCRAFRHTTGRCATSVKRNGAKSPVGRPRDPSALPRSGGRDRRAHQGRICGRFRFASTAPSPCSPGHRTDSMPGHREKARIKSRKCQ